jgi:predicted  nucleic acid-binding Zn-ribbon protein
MEDAEKEKAAQLASMETEKERKIRHYMQLQDKADAMNEQIYKVCCEVEGLNAQIEAVKKELQKAASKAIKAPTGLAKPSNGNGH